MKKIGVLAGGLFLLATLALLFTGCSVFQRKGDGVAKVHKGHLCTINGTIMEVKDVRKEVKFKGLLTRPEKKMSCKLVIKTDQDEVLTVSNDMIFAVNEASSTVKDSYVECSEASNGRRVAVNTDEEGKLVGIDAYPNPYLEEKNQKE